METQEQSSKSPPQAEDRPGPSGPQDEGYVLSPALPGKDQVQTKWLYLFILGKGYMVFVTLSLIFFLFLFFKIKKRYHVHK